MHFWVFYFVDYFAGALLEIYKNNVNYTFTPSTPIPLNVFPKELKKPPFFFGFGYSIY
jgi:hypothetical protein